MQSNCGKEEITYAGFWARLAAYAIDSLIVFFGLLLVRVFLSGILSLAEGTVFGGNILFHYTLKDIVLYGFQVLYFILFLYCTGTTPGKRLLNLRVISADGEKLLLMDVVYRETVGRFLCGLTMGIGYIFAGVDGQKRGLHDMLCDTRVIYAKRVKVYPVFRGSPQTPPCVPCQVTPAPDTKNPQPEAQMPYQMPPMPGTENPQPGQKPPGAEALQSRAETPYQTPPMPGMENPQSAQVLPGAEALQPGEQMPYQTPQIRDPQSLQKAPDQTPGRQPEPGLGDLRSHENMPPREPRGSYRMVRPEEQNKERDS